MDLITRADLPAKLALFGMDYGDAGVEAGLRAVGIKPTRYQGIAGGKGRISLFDPMVAWVLAAAWESNKRRFTGLDRELEFFRGLYDELSPSPDAKYVPGFTTDREFGAQLLLLTSPRFGFEPRDIRRIVGMHPEVLEMSVRGREFLFNVLQAYNGVYGGAISSLSIDPRQNGRRTIRTQLREFATLWLHEARMRFEIDKFNAFDEAIH
jgi:hypothetical protein